MFTRNIRVKNRQQIRCRIPTPVPILESYISNTETMKPATLIFLSAIVLTSAIRCTSQSEPLPDRLQKVNNELSSDGSGRVTLKPGESHQVKVDGTTYTIVYDKVKVEFSEGVGEGEIMHSYLRGEAKLVVNNDHISLRAEGHYDSGGGRQLRTWTYLKESESTRTVGKIALGVANVYPVSSDLSTTNGYVIDLLIQPQ